MLLRDPLSELKLFLHIITFIQTISVFYESNLVCFHVNKQLFVDLNLTGYNAVWGNISDFVHSNF